MGRSGYVTPGQTSPQDVWNTALQANIGPANERGTWPGARKQVGQDRCVAKLSRRILQPMVAGKQRGQAWT